jgi:hypothetical protein
MMLARVQQRLGLRTLELCPDLIEQRIICAYIALLFTPQAGGCRITTVGWLGTCEVRLTETAPDDAPAGTPPFWLEIYCHASGRTLDSCGCFEFDDAELETAVQLVMETGRELRSVVH